MGERSSALVVGVRCSARVQAPGSKRGDSARRSSDGGEHEEEVERDCPRLGVIIFIATFSSVLVGYSISSCDGSPNEEAAYASACAGVHAHARVRLSFRLLVRLYVRTCMYTGSSSYLMLLHV